MTEPPHLATNKIRRMGSVFRRKSSAEKPRSPRFPIHPNLPPAKEGSVKSTEVAANADLAPPLRHKTIVGKCFCCCMVLTYPADALKYRCVRCNTTNIVTEQDLSDHTKDIHLVSANHLKKLIDTCLAAAGPLAHDLRPRSTHEIFEPLAEYTHVAFGLVLVLTESFLVDLLRGTSQRRMINFIEIRRCFDLLTRLPTKRPLYNALYAASERLRRVNVCSLGNELQSIPWILILLEIPFLSRQISSVYSMLLAKCMLDVPDIRILCYDILKRCIGLLVSVDTLRSRGSVTSWLYRYPAERFEHKVQLLNLYITFNLRRLLNGPTSPQPPRSPNMATVVAHAAREMSPLSGSAREYMASMKNEADPVPESLYGQLFVPEASRSHLNLQNMRIRLKQYGNDWHLKSAAAILSALFKANMRRRDSLPILSFYNSMVDFVNIKQDFDEWQKGSSSKSPVLNSNDEVRLVIAYIRDQHKPTLRMSLYFCQYPALISLGAKISILEHEARRQMERRAEEAFINSLDRHTIIDVYLRIRVRRENIVQDLVRCIQENRENLKKSLKVQFINEPGIDAGGLKKEWLLILTKNLFLPATGMLCNVDDSNYLWFTVEPIQSLEMYTLLGWILGLALYNSNILDLQFPAAMYKVLLGKALEFSDYAQLFPVSSKGLEKLRAMSIEDLEATYLTFEVTYKDVWGTAHTRPLIHGGSDAFVDKRNVNRYIDLYWKYFLQDGIKPQLDALTQGFNDVVGGNALSLFLLLEVQLLLCGSQDKEIDLETLRSVTKYAGWRHGEDGSKLELVQWFWEYLQEQSHPQRQKFLVFVTGSDRIPANGIQNLPLRITLILNRDNHRLPVAHTCFNELALYNYPTKERLIEKLDWAVNGSAGFGIK